MLQWLNYNTMGLLFIFESSYHKSIKNKRSALLYFHKDNNIYSIVFYYKSHM